MVCVFHTVHLGKRIGEKLCLSPLNTLEGKLYVTSALVRSESGDSYLILKRGIKTEREIALEEFASDPTWWGCFSLMDVSMLETIDA